MMNLEEQVSGLRAIEIVYDKESQYLIVAQIGDGHTRYPQEHLTRVGKLLEEVIQQVMEGVKVKVLATDTLIMLDVYRLKPGE